MEFTQQSAAPHNSGAAAHNRPPSGSAKKQGKKLSRLLKWNTIILLISVCILIIAIVAGVAFFKTKEQSKYVDSGKLQAVFLSGGQVYFGNISALNSQYMTLNNIYYLRVNQTVQPNQSNNTANNDVSLVKLGCELHGPTDQMVINADQVIFWENLKSDGQVSKAVAEFVKNNPNGQTCTQPNANSNNNSNTNSNNKQ